jgi:VanZ family protein
MKPLYGFLIWFRPFSAYALITWLVIILIVSSIPSIPTFKIRTAIGDIRLDYLIHICEYGLLASLSYLSITGAGFKMSWSKFILITSGLIFFAIADEFHQKLIPGRFFSYKDLAANLTGIFAASVISSWLFSKTGSYLDGSKTGISSSSSEN